MLLDYWYNDCGGADSSCLIRNFINACGFISYSSGAMEVALGFSLPFKPALLSWFAILGAVVFSTVQTQDMYDQAGDSLRRRRTVPLVIGDSLSRWIIAYPVIFWSLVCPWYWGVDNSGYMVPVALGVTVAYRTLMKRCMVDDKRTFRVWNIWLVSLYTLPLLQSFVLRNEEKTTLYE